MSTTLSNSILSKLSAWYPLDSDFRDVHGGLNLTVVQASYFEAGKIGNYLKPGARARVELPNRVPFSPTTGQLTVGGWVKFDTAKDYATEFSLDFEESGNNYDHALAVYADTDSRIGALSSRSYQTGYGCKQPTNRYTTHNFLLRASKSDGTSVQSYKKIRVSEAAGEKSGWVFVVTTWDSGKITLYIDGEESNSIVGPPDGVNGDELVYFSIGNVDYYTSLSGQDEVFFSTGYALTPEEVGYLYNHGQGRSYESIVADSGTFVVTPTPTPTMTPTPSSEANPGYQFWSIRTTRRSATSSALLVYPEVKFLDANGINLATGGIASQNPEGGPAFPASNAFDGNTSSFSASNSANQYAEHRLVYQFQEPVVVDKVELLANYSAANNSMPREFSIEKSVDGVTWIEAAKFIEQFWVDKQIRTFSATGEDPLMKFNFDGKSITSTKIGTSPLNHGVRLYISQYANIIVADYDYLTNNTTGNSYFTQEVSAFIGGDYSVRFMASKESGDSAVVNNEFGEWHTLPSTSGIDRGVNVFYPDLVNETRTSTYQLTAEIRDNSTGRIVASGSLAVSLNVEAQAVPVSPTPSPTPTPTPSAEPTPTPSSTPEVTAEPGLPPYEYTDVTYSQSSLSTTLLASASNMRDDNAHSVTSSGDTSTGTATDNGSFEYVQIDLGGVVPVSKVILGGGSFETWDAAFMSNPLAYIEHSADGDSWTQLKAVSGISTHFPRDKEFTFDPVETRYLRVSRDGYVCLATFRVFSGLIEYDVNPVVLSQHTSSTSGMWGECHVVMPEVVNAGDLLLVTVAASGTTQFTVPSDWNVLDLASNAMLIYKIADGTESGTTSIFPMTQSRYLTSMLVRLMAGTFDPNVPPEISKRASSGGNVTFNALTPSWGAANSLWLAQMAGVGRSTIRSAPLPNGGIHGKYTTATGTSYCEVASCWNRASVASMTPRAMTKSAASAYNAYTIAIKAA